MKKILIGAITALALLFGMTGCSGDLHNDEKATYDLSAGGIAGAGVISGWSNVVSWSEVDSNVYKYTFIADAAEIEWKVLFESGKWNEGAWGGEGSVKEVGTDEVTLDYDGKSGAGKNCKSSFTQGNEYSIVITCKEDGSVTAKIVAGEEADVIAVSNATDGLSNIPVTNGSYTYTWTPSTTDEKIYVYNATKKVYYKTSAALVVDADAVSATVSEDKKAITTSGVVAGTEYKLLVTLGKDDDTAPTIELQTNQFVSYLNGSIVSDWVKLGNYTKNIGYYEFTLAADYNDGWNSNATDTVSFKIKNINNWNSDDDTVFGGVTIEPNGKWVDSDSSASGNATIEGVEAGKTYRIFIDGRESEEDGYPGKDGSYRVSVVPVNYFTDYMLTVISGADGYWKATVDSLLTYVDENTSTAVVTLPTLDVIKQANKDGGNDGWASLTDPGTSFVALRNIVVDEENDDIFKPDGSWTKRYEIPSGVTGTLGTAATMQTDEPSPRGTMPMACNKKYKLTFTKAGETVSVTVVENAE